MNSRSTHMYWAPTDELRFANCRMRRIGRRIHRARADVAEAARHADAVRPHQVLAVVVARDRCSSAPGPTPWRPSRRTPDSGTGAGRRCRWHSRRTSRPAASCRRRAACRASRSATPGYLLSFSNGSARAVLAAHVEPEAAPVRVGPGRGLEARLVDQAEVLPAIGPRVAEAGMRADDLQQVEGAEGVVASCCPRSGRCRRSRPATCCGP